MNWQEFFNMGGYGFYVWTAYGLMAIVMLLNIIIPLRQKTEVLAQLAQKAARRKTP